MLYSFSGSWFVFGGKKNYAYNDSIFNDICQVFDKYCLNLGISHIGLPFELNDLKPFNVNLVNKPPREIGQRSNSNVSIISTALVPSPNVEQMVSNNSISLL